MYGYGQSQIDLLQFCLLAFYVLDVFVQVLGERHLYFAWDRGLDF